MKLSREDEAVLNYLRRKSSSSTVIAERVDIPPSNLPRRKNMATGTITREFADTFPTIPRRVPSTGPRRTDVDVALDDLRNSTPTYPTQAMKVIDYKVDPDGNPVDEQAARQRAHARVQAMRKRGYTKDAGWKLAAIDGCVWAQFYGEGNHPVKETKETAAEAAAAIPAADSVPAPV